MSVWWLEAPLMPKKIEQVKVELQEWMGSDRSIANAAWSSSYDNEVRKQKSDADVEKRVRGCARDGHAVPFESVIFRFWYRWPVFCDRQHMTHRIASHNGLSARYRTVPSEYYRIPEDVKDIIREALRELHGTDVYVKDWFNRYDQLCQESYYFYKEMLDQLRTAEKVDAIDNADYKRAREIIRGVLGTNFIVERTSIFNLRSFANYIRLRNSDHAQPEIKFAAQEMLRLVKEANICPVALKALDSVGWKI
jgi:flavin-dependent thymidylate synthase